MSSTASVDNISSPQLEHVPMDGFGARQRALEGGWYRQEELRALQRRAEKLRGSNGPGNALASTSEAVTGAASRPTSLLDLPVSVSGRRACEVAYKHTPSPFPGKLTFHLLAVGMLHRRGRSSQLEIQAIEYSSIQACRQERGLASLCVGGHYSLIQFSGKFRSFASTSCCAVPLLSGAISCLQQVITSHSECCKPYAVC